MKQQKCSKSGVDKSWICWQSRFDRNREVGELWAVAVLVQRESGTANRSPGNRCQGYPSLEWCGGDGEPVRRLMECEEGQRRARIKGNDFWFLDASTVVKGYVRSS
jgi:hypothetical protein